jgi:hypothetical protein
MPVPPLGRSRFILALSAVAITLACGESTTAPADPERPPISAAITTTPVWRQVSAGADHTCGGTRLALED